MEQHGSQVHIGHDAGSCNVDTFQMASDERTRKEGTYTTFWHFVQSVNEILERRWLVSYRSTSTTFSCPRPDLRTNTAYELEVTTVTNIPAPLPDNFFIHSCSDDVNEMRQRSPALVCDRAAAGSDPVQIGLPPIRGRSENAFRVLHLPQHRTPGPMPRTRAP